MALFWCKTQIGNNMNLLKELLTLTEGGSKRYIEDLIEKAIKLVDANGMSYEDAVDTIADKVKELAQPDQQIVDTDMLIDMIKAVYDDELTEDESMDDALEPVKPKLLGKAGDYKVMLDDDEQVNLYYEDEMLTTMPLVIWKQLTKI